MIQCSLILQSAIFVSIKKASSMLTTATMMTDEYYYETWDQINRRFLVKSRMEDEWSPIATPEIFSNKDRVFDAVRAIYYKPQLSIDRPGRQWDVKEGQWVLLKKKCNTSIGRTTSEETDEENNCHMSTASKCQSTKSQPSDGRRRKGKF